MVNERSGLDAGPWVTAGSAARRACSRVGSPPVGPVDGAGRGGRLPGPRVSAGNLSAGPLAGALGYANAEAALAVQVGAMGLVAGSTVGRRWSWMWLASAVATMSVTAIVSSAAGVALAGLVLLVAGYAFLARRPSARWAPLVGASAILGAGAVRWR